MIRIFVSYAHEDARWVKSGSLIPSLEASLRKDGAKFWYAPSLVGGRSRRKEN